MINMILQNAFINSDGVTVVSTLNDVDFYNCIVDGDQEIEFETVVASKESNSTGSAPVPAPPPPNSENEFTEVSI